MSGVGSTVATGKGAARLKPEPHAVQARRSMWSRWAAASRPAWFAARRVDAYLSLVFAYGKPKP